MFLRTATRPFVLFARTWENNTVIDLKRVLNTRALSPKARRSSPSRNASFTSPGVSPGIPSQPTSEIPDVFTNINLPDISQPDLEADVQIPFVPDFWESSSANSITATEPTIPKLLVVAGADTYHPGPSHNLHDDDSDTQIDPPANRKAPGGFWQDIAEDIGIPANIYAEDTKLAVFDHIPDASGTVPTKHIRTLDQDETRGIWVLLGLLAGSWILGGVNDRPSAKSVTEHSREKA